MQAPATPSDTMPRAHEGDTALMVRVAAGDDRALGLLFDRHGRLAWSIAMGIVGDHETAHEVVQDAWVDLWRTAPTFDPDRASVTTWLVRLVRLRSVDRIRRERALRRGSEFQRADMPVEVAAANVASGDDIEGEQLADERARGVRAALAQLPTQQRVLVELAFLHGYTHSELATALGMPPGTIKTRLFRGLARLHELMSPATEGALQ